MKWIRRVLLGTAALVIVLASVGAIYQLTGAALDRRAVPAPGRMVTVDGHQMHVHCTGSGAPTIVLEAGATGFAQTWAWIQPELSQQTRVCSYDRAGLGWSQDWKTAHDGATTARRLKALLDRAGESGPFVMVGHSLGGTLVRIFADQNPDDVVALALIDPSHEDQLERFPPEIREQQEGFYRMIDLAARLSYIGVLRATNLIGRNAEGLPEPDYRTARMFASSPKHLRVSHAEMLTWDETMEAARQSQPLGDRPLLVLSATDAMTGMPPEMIPTNQQMHSELATLSSRGRHVILEGTDHYSLLMSRDDASRVAEEIVAVLNESR